MKKITLLAALFWTTRSFCETEELTKTMDALTDIKRKFTVTSNYNPTCPSGKEFTLFFRVTEHELIIGEIQIKEQ